MSQTPYVRTNRKRLCWLLFHLLFWFCLFHVTVSTLFIVWFHSDWNFGSFPFFHSVRYYVRYSACYSAFNLFVNLFVIMVIIILVFTVRYLFCYYEFYYVRIIFIDIALFLIWKTHSRCTASSISVHYELSEGGEKEEYRSRNDMLSCL